MTYSVKTLLFAAAGTGLMSGTATVPANSQPRPSTAAAPCPWTPWARGPDYLAQTPRRSTTARAMNSCKGQGGCNTGDMGCKAKNSCKGKGGCKTDM